MMWSAAAVRSTLRTALLLIFCGWLLTETVKGAQAVARRHELHARGCRRAHREAVHGCRAEGIRNDLRGSGVVGSVNCWRRQTNVMPQGGAGRHEAERHRAHRFRHAGVHHLLRHRLLDLLVPLGAAQLAEALEVGWDGGGRR